ncbi:MAG TPA: hypothetical protein VHW47_00945 [Acidimicrobiales bacterium]|nr:hypothetical protein [Acidimicrobiales bacterium]
MVPWEPGLTNVQAILCDYAEEANGKLTMVGAGTTRLPSRPQPPHPIFGALAMLVRIPWVATNQEQRLTIELRVDLGVPTSLEGETSQRVPINVREQTWLPEEERGIATLRFNVGRSPNTTPGEDTLLPTVLPLYGRQVPQLGSYFFMLTMNGEPVDRVSFQVFSPVMPQG